MADDAEQKIRAKIKADAELIQDAARVLIGTVCNAKNDKGEPASFGEIELEADLSAGGTEVWKITIERISRVQ